MRVPFNCTIVLSSLASASALIIVVAMHWIPSFKYVVIIAFLQLIPLTPGEISVGIGYIHTIDHNLFVSLPSMVAVLTLSMSAAWVGPSSPMTAPDGSSDISLSIILGVHVGNGSLGFVGGQWENALNLL